MIWGPLTRIYFNGMGTPNMNFFIRLLCRSSYQPFATKSPCRSRFPAGKCRPEMRWRRPLPTRTQMAKITPQVLRVRSTHIHTYMYMYVHIYIYRHASMYVTYTHAHIHVRRYIHTYRGYVGFCSISGIMIATFCFGCSDPKGNEHAGNNCQQSNLFGSGRAGHRQRAGYTCN